MKDKSEVLKILQSRTIINPITGCWEIREVLESQTYGKVKIYNNRKTNNVTAHRASLWITGVLHDLDSLALVLHKCHNKMCWNPEHLYLGDESDNAKDAIDNKKHGGYHEKMKTHCPKGHEYNRQNTYIRSNGKRKCRKCSNHNQIDKRIRLSYEKKALEAKEKVKE